MEGYLNEYKSGLGVKWVRAQSGTTYLCPEESLRGLQNPTEEQLRAIGVDESMNPHND